MVLPTEDATPLQKRYSPVVNFSLFMALMAAAIYSWNAGYWWITVLCWPPMWHLGHTMLLAFHEGVHYNLSTNRWANEIRAFNLGAAGWIPLSVYRHLHGYHHARLSTEDDAELWPYTQPNIPRWARIGCAFLELTLGYFVTPLVFLRGVLVDKKMTPELRRRIAWEYLLMIAIWAVILGTIAYHQWWPGFLVGYLIPAMGAANLQTWRKFIEHMGLVGNSPMTLSRTVTHRGPLGKTLSATMLNVNYHGTHHRFGKMHFHELPEATPRAIELDCEPLPTYPTYFSALVDMLPSLANPRCGHQWVAEEVPATDDQETPEAVAH